MPTATVLIVHVFVGTKTYWNFGPPDRHADRKGLAQRIVKKSNIGVKMDCTDMQLRTKNAADQHDSVTRDSGWFDPEVASKAQKTPPQKWVRFLQSQQINAV